MSEINCYTYISYNQIPSYYSGNAVKFKEWYWDANEKVYKPTEGKRYMILNLDKVEYIYLDFECDLVQVYFGQSGNFCGKFFAWPTNHEEIEG